LAEILDKKMFFSFETFEKNNLNLSPTQRRSLVLQILQVCEEEVAG